MQLKAFWVGPHNSRRYKSPYVQIALLGFVTFCTVGMFQALSGTGGGGQVQPQTADLANLILYAVFGGTAFFCGSVVNTIGVRISLALGTIGYCLFAASFLSINTLGPDKANAFVIAASTILGVSAALLWTAQGSIVLSYPAEKDKSKSFALFWIIFNLGAVLGSFINIGSNWNNSTGTVTNGTYIGFIVIMVVGLFIPIFLCPSSEVIRKDHTKVIVPLNPTWKKEIIGLFVTLYKYPWFVLLFPLCGASNFFYTLQDNEFTAPNFTLRARAINGLLKNLGGMVGAGVAGPLFDLGYFSRKDRARYGLISMFVFTMVVWGGGWAFMNDRYRGVSYTLIDVSDQYYSGLAILALMYGIFDAVFQTYAYFLMGCFTNDQAILCNFTGFYKGIQSAMAAVAFSLDLNFVSYQSMYIATWVLCASSLIIAVWPVFTKVVEHQPQLSEDGELVLVEGKGEKLQYLDEEHAHHAVTNEKSVRPAEPPAQTIDG